MVDARPGVDDHDAERTGKRQFQVLSFSYVFVIDRDDEATTSPFQGFSQGVTRAAEMMERVANMPSDIFEPAWNRETVLARRISGAAPLYWSPMTLEKMNGADFSEDMPFWIVFCTMPNVVEGTKAWAARQKHKPLVIGYAASEGVLSIDDFTPERLQDFARVTLEAVKDDSFYRDHARELLGILDEWKPWFGTKPEVTIRGHNVTGVNRGTLSAMGFKVNIGEPLASIVQQDYVDAIFETVHPILSKRRGIVPVEPNRLLPRQPEIILAAASVYHLLGKRRPGKNPTGLDRFLEIMRKQERFSFTGTEADFRELADKASGLAVASVIRGTELAAFSGALALNAASIASAVIRISPGVNRISKSLIPMANSARGSNIQARRKLPKLFGAIQDDLASAVGDETLAVLETSAHGVKIVSDVPLEWLPVGRLPLSLHTDTSRLPATPGNLLVSQLRLWHPIMLPKSAFEEILVISSFTAGDPIAHAMKGSLEVISRHEGIDVRARVVTVQSVDEFVAALNSYDGPMLVFDGHGSHDETTNIGAIHIGSEKLDVWKLRGKVRVPPIVVLSACDTQAIERSHASTGNGFLALDAQAVLATLLPVSAVHSSVFIGRLILRMSEFIRAKSRAGRSAVWSEVVSGLLRMTLATDFLRAYEHKFKLTFEQYEPLAFQANMLINSNTRDWPDKVIDMVSQRFSLRRELVEGDFRRAVAFSDAIRYTHIGSPERIVIVDDKVWEGKYSGADSSADKLETPGSSGDTSLVARG